MFFHFYPRFSLLQFSTANFGFEPIFVGFFLINLILCKRLNPLHHKIEEGLVPPFI